MEAWRAELCRNELYHHGIKGQRWGVRRGPPYPIEDTVMLRGTKLNSVSGYSDSEEYRNSRKWIYTFNPDDEHDSKIYKGPFSYYLKEDGFKYIYEHRFETVKHLKMPTKKERIDEFIDIYKSNKLGTTLDLARIQLTMKLQGVGSEEIRKLNVWKADLERDRMRLYRLFNHAMQEGEKFRSTREYMKIMESKYDAMVDDNNQGVYNHAHDPVIIFKAHEALKTIGDVRLVEVKEIAENIADLEDMLAERGERISL